MMTYQGRLAKLVAQLFFVQSARLPVASLKGRRLAVEKRWNR
jgi:hypothetical protein